MEKAAVVHNPDNYFFYSAGRDTFTVKLMAKAGDVSLAALHYRDKYIPLDKLDTRGKVSMRRVAGDGIHDYYEAELKVNMLCIRYFFELTDSRGEVTYYGNHSFYDRMPECIEEMFDCPQLSREEEKYEASEWARGKVVYQIFVDRFATDRNVSAEEWYRQDLGHRDSLRGSLKGITEKIPYLKELGAEVLYLTPIFQAETTHKYDTVDYMRVDPEFGTEEDLRELTETAHGAGMYVILDAVFNHTSRHFFAFQDLLQNQEASLYRDWYYVDDFPVRGEFMPSYRSFSYFGGMPKLNCRNPEVRDYIFGVIRHWTRECHVDGWRLDVADEIGRDFWREFRRELRRVNPQALIVGEIWYFNGSYLEGDQWDSVMNYHFTEAVRGFLLERTLTAKEFAERLDFVRGRLKKEAVPYLWNLIDSHDTDRFLTQAGGDRKLLKLAATLQLLLPGMPMIYYGDEVGMTGQKKGSGCRHGMLWEKERQDTGLLEYYKKLIAIRKKYPAVARGEANWKLRGGADRLLCWEAELAGEIGVAVAVNCGGDTQDCSEWAGRRIAASEAVFDGILEPFQAVVLEFVKKS